MSAILELMKKLETRANILSSIVCQVNSTLLPAVYRAAGVDCLVLDLEHGGFSPENMGDFAFAARVADMPVIARVADCTYYCISKPLDMGADGILLPRTETAQQVETAISAMRFYPEGKKGAGGRALLRAGETVGDFNKQRLLFLQIESPAGIASLDELLIRYSEQVAGILIGPYDMAVSMGCGLDIHAEPVEEGIKKIIEICQKHGKSIGMFLEKAEDIKPWHDSGMNIFWVGSELGLLSNSLHTLRSAVDQVERRDAQ